MQCLLLLTTLFIFAHIGGASNDCAICASGSSGTCEEDKVNCEELPWYRDDLCGDDDYIAAGKNGCAKCKFIRKVCAKSCNWCTLPKEGRQLQLLNECSSCASGSSGTCEEDKVNCKELPWYRDDLCGDDDYVAAGKNGCAKCKFIRNICAKSCNWCTISDKDNITSPAFGVNQPDLKNQVRPRRPSTTHEMSVNCRWGSYGSWSPCTQTCGGCGTQIRTRSIVQHAEGAGRQCTGWGEQKRSCGSQRCPPFTATRRTTTRRPTTTQKQLLSSRPATTTIRRPSRPQSTTIHQSFNQLSTTRRPKSKVVRPSTNANSIATSYTNGLRKFKALYDFDARSTDELSFQKRDILYVANKDDSKGWRRAINSKGDNGLIPSNYVVEILDDNVFVRTGVTVGSKGISPGLLGSKSALEGSRAYVENVRNFEDRAFRAAARTALKGVWNIRKSGRRYGNALWKGARTFRRNAVQGIHTVARSTRKMAKSAGLGMKTMARVAETGLSNVGSAARKRVSVFGHGLRRFRDGTKLVGHRLFDSAASASRGLSHIRDSYERNAILPRTSIGNQIYA